MFSGGSEYAVGPDSQTSEYQKMMNEEDGQPIMSPTKINPKAIDEYLAYVNDENEFPDVPARDVAGRGAATPRGAEHRR